MNPVHESLLSEAGFSDFDMHMQYTGCYAFDAEMAGVAFSGSLFCQRLKRSRLAE